jgi:hypothetical protein
LSTRALICAYATDVLATYPERAFGDVAVVRPFCGRLSVLIDAPEDIRRVLVDNDARYAISVGSARGEFGSVPITSYRPETAPAMIH